MLRDGADFIFRRQSHGEKDNMEAGWMRRAGEEKNGDKLVLTHLRPDWKEKMVIPGG